MGEAMKKCEYAKAFVHRDGIRFTFKFAGEPEQTREIQEDAATHWTDINIEAVAENEIEFNRYDGVKLEITRE